MSGRDVEKASGVGAKIIGAYFLTIMYVSTLNQW